MISNRTPSKYNRMKEGYLRQIVHIHVIIEALSVSLLILQELAERKAKIPMKIIQLNKHSVFAKL
jgi:hypothetical protein